MTRDEGGNRMDFKALVDAYFRSPSQETLIDLKRAITSDVTFDPYTSIDQRLAPLVNGRRHREVIATISAEMPGLFLSPGVHGTLSTAHRALGEAGLAELELIAAQIALRTITDSGEGSPDDPWRVLRVRDEYDVLDLTDRSSVHQEARAMGNRTLDVHRCNDGSTVAFLLETT